MHVSLSLFLSFFLNRYVEDKMLKRSATLRKMWLVTDALKKLHHQAVLKVK